VCLFSGKWFSGNHFPNFSVFVCHYESWSTENTFQSKENLVWFPGKCFLFILGGKHFLEVMKNLEMSYYLLITSNLVPKLLTAIYIYFLLWIFVFQFHPLEFNFYINFGSYFYNCYLLFPYYFLIKFFIYQIWSSFFWLFFILFEIIYEILIIIILISSSFIFFIL